MPKAKGGLGFKKLSTFNLALLAKQGWRLLQDEHSLLHRIYKVRYFPSCSLLESQLGLNSSYAWREIWVAKPWLKKGSIWRIGNGERMHIWNDHWIPRLKPAPFPRAHNSLVSLEETATVN